MMKQRSYSTDRSVKSDKVRRPKLDDRSTQSKRSVRSSATTGKLDKNGRRQTKYREKSKRDLRASGPSNDKQPKKVSLDPPTEIRVVESQPVADWRNVSSARGKSRRSTSDSKPFTLGKMMNRMSFRKKKPDEFSASATDAPSSVSGGASARAAPRETVSRRVRSTLLPLSLRGTAKSGSDVQSHVSDGNTRRNERPSDGRRKTRLTALPAKDSDVPNFQHLLDAERKTILGARGISRDSGEPTNGDVQSVVSDGALMRSRKNRVQSDHKDRSQVKATQLRQTSQRSGHKPDIASDLSGDETRRISKVNFKPTTIARYMEDSTVSQCVRTVTTCEVDTLGASSMSRKKMKKSKKKKHKHRSKSRERESNGQECRVMGFPFTELNTGIRGIYSGPVNDVFQPHGEGEFHILNPSDGSRFQFKGTKWENGFMISHQLLMFRKTIEAGDLNVNLTDRDTEIQEEKLVRTKTTSGTDVASSLNSRMKKEHSKDENRQSSLVPMGLNIGAISDGGKSDHAVNATATDYSLGEVARSRDDMLIAADSIQALKAASTIKIHDKAFLQRSNGLWTVAMLADRSMQPKNSYRVSSKWYTEDEIKGYKSEVIEESLLFVINLEGGTKIVPKRYWGRCIRKINPNGYGSSSSTTITQSESIIDQDSGNAQPYSRMAPTMSSTDRDDLLKSSLAKNDIDEKAKTC